MRCTREVVSTRHNKRVSIFFSSSSCFTFESEMTGTSLSKLVFISGILFIFIAVWVSQVESLFVPKVHKNFPARLLLTSNSSPSIEEVAPQISVTSESNTQKIQVTLNEEDLDECFTKGTGNGGQKINTTANRVVLVHKPTGIKVSCQDARDLHTNRKWARELLLEKLDFHYNGAKSKIALEQSKVKRRKKDAARKSKRKYDSKTPQTQEEEKEGEGEDEDIESLLESFRQR